MIWVIIILILSGYTASEEINLQWTEGVSGKLQRGEVITYRGYSVEVVVFPPPVESDKYKDIPAEPVNPYAGFNISKDGIFIDTIILGLAESYITPDNELKITVKELPSSNSREWLFESYEPWVKVELNPRGIPKLEISIHTEQDRYISSSTDIVATVKLENKGSADAYNVDMEIDTGLSLKRGRLKYHYETVKKGEIITQTITFATPILSQQTRFKIFANATGYDVKDVSYYANTSIDVLITPEPKKSLSISKSTIGKMYLKDYAIVSLYVKNNGIHDLKNVSITDYIPKSFKLLGNHSLHWVVDIPANGEWENRYLIKPVEPNRHGIILPSATAEFRIDNEFYSIQSNQPEIVVYGPRIIITKQTDVSVISPGDTVTVMITAENIGSTPTRVIIKDFLPKSASIILGNTQYETFLEANKKVSFSYTLRIDSKTPVRLPRAIAEYFELGNKGQKISTTSNEIEIKIRLPTQISHVPIKPSPTPVVTPVIPEPVSPPEPDSTDLNQNLEQPQHHIFFLEYLLRCNDNTMLSACNFLRNQSRK